MTINCYLSSPTIGSKRKLCISIEHMWSLTLSKTIQNRDRKEVPSVEGPTIEYSYILITDLRKKFQDKGVEKWNNIFFSYSKAES